MSHTDNDLLQQFMEGDLSAFDALMEQYARPVFGFIFSLVKNAHDAEELTQDTFLKAFTKAASFNTTKSFKTWIYTIARNTAFDFFKKKKSIPFAELGNEDEVNDVLSTVVDEEPLPPALFESHNTASILEKSLNMLPLHVQSVLRLHYLDDLSFAQIADVLNISVDTVKSINRRGVASLRVSLKRVAPRFFE